MAINNNTSVKINGLAVYNFSAGKVIYLKVIWVLSLETGPTIVNTSAKIDRPDG
jgi:hypothetical protein